MIFIIGIKEKNEDKGKIYRLLVTSKENGEVIYKAGDILGQDLKNKMIHGLKIENAAVVKGEIVGVTGSLERFRGKGINSPFVIISEIRHVNGNILGYRVVNLSGTVKSIRLNDVIKYCREITNRGGLPLQNGAFVEGFQDIKPHIRSFKTEGFPREIIGSRVKQVNKPIMEKKEVGDRLSERFNKEQINELMAGKISGVDIRIYADERFSAEQMRVVREGLEKGIRAEIYADPRFSVKQMIRLKVENGLGYDVLAYANPEYSLGQMTQIKLGVISGVDTDLYANPKTTASEMEQIRVRLENGIWCDCEASKLDVSKL